MPEEAEIKTLTADIVTAFVSNNPVPRGDLPKVIRDVYDALVKVGDDNAQTPPQEPAVPIRTSIKSDFLVCLECGHRFKSIKRHLRTAHNVGPEEYRAKWSLSPDYPMVAKNYAEKRSQLAKEIGLGRKP